MMQRYFLSFLAILGLAGAAATIVADHQEAPAEVPWTIPAGPPYENFIAGGGLVEASTGNIVIGSPVAGIASELHVHVGEFVAAGAPLFQVDDRDKKAQLVAARARVTASQALLQQPRHRLSYFEDLAKRDPSAVRADAITDLRDQVAVAESNLALAEALVAQLNLEIERYTVRAPVAGRVLQLDLRAGEYVDGSMTPLVLLGDDRSVFVRVDIDESDAWRVTAGANATAFVRGNATLRFPLTFEYVVPHIIPKRSLTGRSTERTDTRVLQVLYSFKRGTLPVYVGQQLDVFIEATPVDPLREEQAIE